MREMGETNEMGLWISKGAHKPINPFATPMLRDSLAYVTFREIAALQGKRISLSEGDVVDRLRRLSTADCMGIIARISSRLAISPNPSDPETQFGLAAWLGGDGWLTGALTTLIGRPQPTVAFFEQQLVHLARLVILHADPRPGDGFDNSNELGFFVDCLFGASGLLDEDLDVSNPDALLTWELKQCGVNHHEDQAPVIGLYHEVYRDLLPAMKPKPAAKIEAAFKDHTGISMSEYFVIGSAVQARFINATIENHGLALAPDRYFASVELEPEEWGCFFKLTARNQTEMARALREEDADYGPTTYGSLTFERFPLFEREPGIYLPISMRSYVRRITTGVSHILTEAAEKKHRDRRTWTSHFGIPFQRSVENTIRRGIEASTPEAGVSGEISYVNEEGNRVDSTDVMVTFPDEPLLIEVVSGPMQVATMTRGGIEAFESDLKRLVVRKAEQIERTLNAVRSGRLEIPGFDLAQAKRVWPVIISAEPFPQREVTGQKISSALAEAEVLNDELFAPLSLISAEELFFCEGYMQQGEGLLDLIRGWKASPGAMNSFKNFLIARGNGGAPGSDHFEGRFGEATAEVHRGLFGSELSGEEVLRELEERVEGDDGPEDDEAG